MIQFIQTHITVALTFLTFLSNIIFVVVIFLFIAHDKFRLWAYKFINENVLSLLFVVSLAAVLGSLTYSEIVGFPPCELCWIQRIFMYPQVLLSFFAMLKKPARHDSQGDAGGDKNIVAYLLPLSILGAIVSLYHSLIHWRLISGSFLACTSSLTAPCAKVYVMEYGYITIPFMAFSLFVYLITISLIYYKSKNVG